MSIREAFKIKKRTIMKLSVEEVAKICHEVNKSYCESIGDNSVPSWDDAPEWQKETVVNGVNFHLCNPDSSPSDSHNNWMKKKEEEGWKYGPIKDPENKEHPCYVPYQELPREQQSKDYIFMSIVKTIEKL